MATDRALDVALDG